MTINSSKRIWIGLTMSIGISCILIAVSGASQASRAVRWESWTRVMEKDFGWRVGRCCKCVCCILSIATSKPLSTDVNSFFREIQLFEMPWNATADMICQVSLDGAQGCAGTLGGDVWETSRVGNIIHLYYWLYSTRLTLKRITGHFGWLHVI